MILSFDLSSCFHFKHRYFCVKDSESGSWRSDLGDTTPPPLESSLKGPGLGCTRRLYGLTMLWDPITVLIKDGDQAVRRLHQNWEGRDGINRGQVPDAQASGAQVVCRAPLKSQSMNLLFWWESQPPGAGPVQRWWGTLAGVRWLTSWWGS